MQFHLIAFTPFIVLVGVGMLVGAVSLIVTLASPKVRLAPVSAAPAMPRRSAEILTFPAPKARAAAARRPLPLNVSASQA
jgi:hypothetical protein